MNAKEIATRAAELVGGERNRTHGECKGNHQRIAALWNAYLSALHPGMPLILQPQHVACMMVLLKIARTTFGAHNADDYVDAVGYAAIAGDIAERDAAIADRITAHPNRDEDYKVGRT